MKIFESQILTFLTKSDGMKQSYIHELISYIEADIDWGYMDVYVRAMEKKQVIADVVDYKNEVIARTKELVEK